ncbi:glycosyltransferase family 4 protein [Cohnella thailandensis]|uniref:Glycosyltransferase family 4 protein n=1 Tax=Cohnella thailandensis TaxID=557557 RepID=A0A841SQG4_9BACL|nr:glycosyltransferase family 4 protein [Cohnella thailandensis]MBB6633109.1 glycosyltransferase family 4 protein [Cohnella thailandensis]MBP1975196.1 phosphatidylinositol alpha-1,6-mannosyltransferase [Cohnella thailandensis]
MKRRKVVLVTGVFPPGIGGMQNYYYNLSKHTKHKLTVLASEYPGSAEFDREQSFPIERGEFLRGEGIDIGRWGSLFRHVRRTLRREEPDVTLYGYVLIGVIGLLFHWFGGRRYIISTHGMDMLMFRRFPGLNQLVKLILRKADGVLTNSEYTRNLVLEYGVDPRRISIVNPGVESLYDKAEPNPELVARHRLENKYVLLTVGRLVRRKGHDRVIEAMPAILKRIPNAVYLIVGDGPERERLAKLAKDIGVGEEVRFVGSVGGSERLNEYFNLANQFVMVARELKEGDAEGFGIVYLEAASACVPVIAGRSGGASEAVLDGLTGVLVDPESTSEIAEAVARLSGDAALRERLIRNGYRRAKTQFQHHALAEAFDAYVDRVCSRPAKRRKPAKKPAVGKIHP